MNLRLQQLRMRACNEVTYEFDLAFLTANCAKVLGHPENSKAIYLIIKCVASELKHFLTLK